MKTHAAFTGHTPPHRHFSRPAAVSRLEHEINMAARSAAPVLLTGSVEAAQALAYRIHTASGWRYGPFVTVDCAAVASVGTSLFEAVFPGHSRSEEGPVLQLAQQGTVLLQEIGRLSRPMQEMLAERLTEAITNRPPGRTCRRVIASTSEPLLERVENGTFDDRLYYRLNLIHLMAFVTPD
jgi:DNA-binding NtrC family response regulator